MPVRLSALCLLLLVTPLPAQDKKEDAGPFKHLEFRLLGPSVGGRVSRACGVVGDPNVYYLGAASGGAWKSVNGGASWKPIFDDQPTSSIGAVAVAPSDANVVYVGSGEANIRGNVAPGNGIYRSTDAGKSWKHVWKQKGQISHIIVHPENADVAYAAVFGSAFAPNAERGIYRTTEGGKNWQQILKHDADTGGIDICFDPANPRILFAALWQARRTPWSLTSGGPGSGLFRSGDGGDTWKKLGPAKITFPSEAAKKAGDDEDNGLPEGVWGRIGIAIAPSDSSRIYALIEAEKGGLYRSDDGGEKWELVNGQRYLQVRPWYFSIVRVDPQNADVVYVCNLRLLKSVDGGKTFKNIKGPHHVDHHDLWIDPKNPQRMIDSNDGGVDITTDGGGTWHPSQLPICQFYHIACDTSVPYRVMGTMQDQGTASGPSNSLTSTGVMLHDWHSVGGGETGFAVPDPSDPNIIFAGEYMGIITRYDLRTRQARNVSILPITSSGKGAAELKYRFQWTAPILISPHDPKTIYHAANVLFRTRDAGKTWDKISPDLTRDDKGKQQWSGGPITGDNTGAETYCTLFAVAESPAKKGVLWAGSDDGLVHVSSDDGKSWTDVTKNIPGLPEWATVCCIEPDRKDPAVAYVVVDAHRLDDNSPYLWKTADLGKTWFKLTTNLPADDYLRVVRVDPVVPGMLYLGSENGLYFRKDDAGGWHPIKMNFPTVAVADLVVQVNDLVVGTNGRSIWILDDLTPLRQWSPGLEGKPHFFPVLPAMRWRLSDGGYRPEDAHPGANPPAGAIVNYYLPQKPKDELVLEILDAKGAAVQKLTSKKVEPAEKEEDPDAPWSIYKPTVLPKEAGIQRVAWNLRAAGPTIIPGAKNDYGVPYQGFLVPPGTYTLRLNVDGIVLTQHVEVKLDPRLEIAKEDGKSLEENYALAGRVRDDISTVSRIVIAVQKVRRQLREQMPAWDKDITKDATALIERLDALEEKLHNPRAQVSYDILAQKGGAKLYSQLTGLFDFVSDTDGPITQGMKETYEDWSRELKGLEAEWASCVQAIESLNDRLHKQGVRHVVIPKEKN